jgi:hypothetical protein
LERGLNAYLCGDSIDLNKQNLETMREVCAGFREQQAALESIAKITDADDLLSYRADDGEGCLDTVYATATEALSKYALEKP